jgi:hypothetical protein
MRETDRWLTRTGIHEKDPLEFWNTFEVNVKGVFNFVR